MAVGRVVGASGKAGRKAVGVPVVASGTIQRRVSFLLIGAGGGIGGGGQGQMGDGIGGDAAPVAFDYLLDPGTTLTLGVGPAGLSGDWDNRAGMSAPTYSGITGAWGRGGDGGTSNGANYGTGGTGGGATLVMIGDMVWAASGGGWGGAAAPSGSWFSNATIKGVIPASPGGPGGGGYGGHGGGGGYGGIGGMTVGNSGRRGTSGLNLIPFGALPYTGPSVTNYPLGSYGGGGSYYVSRMPQPGIAVIALGSDAKIFTTVGQDIPLVIE